MSQQSFLFGKLSLSKEATDRLNCTTTYAHPDAVGSQKEGDLRLDPRRFEMATTSSGEQRLAPKTRRCSRCGQTKALRQFGRNPAHPFGRTYHCKSCIASRVRAWR